MSAFDVSGPLPRGVTVLEASAGTGKTYTIAALAARYVAEGTPLEELLLVTFTRMATGELRERVRDRLVAVERGLGTGVSDDEIVALLASGAVGDASAAGFSAPGVWGPRGGRRAAALPKLTPGTSPPHTASARRCSAGSGSS